MGSLEYEEEGEHEGQGGEESAAADAVGRHKKQSVSKHNQTLVDPPKPRRHPGAHTRTCTPKIQQVQDAPQPMGGGCGAMQCTGWRAYHLGNHGKRDS